MLSRADHDYDSNIFMNAESVVDWSSHHEFIYHLLRFSRLTLCVLGSEDNGLSLFKAQCLQRAPNDLNFVKLSAQEITHPAELIDQLYLRFRIEPSDDELPLQQQVIFFNEQLSYAQKIPVLVVEQLQFWNAEMLSNFFKIIALEHNGKPSLRCLFFAEPESITLFKQAGLGDYIQKNCHLLQLNEQALSEFSVRSGELKADIGNHTSKSAVQVEQVNHGNRIKTMSKKEWLKPVRNYLLSLDSWIKSWPFHWLLGGGVAFLLVLTVSLQLLWQQDSRQKKEFPMRELGVLQPKKMKTDLTNLGIVGNDKHLSEATKSITITAKKLPAAVQIAQRDIAAEAQAVKKAAEKKDLNEARQISFDSSVNKHEEKVVPPVINEQAVKLAAKKVSKKPTLHKFSLDERKLLHANKNHYTVQLLGTSKKAGLLAMKDQYDLDDSWAAHTERNGGSWFILFQGDYPSRAQAQQAIKALPKKLQSLQPWPRKLAEVQDDIRSRISF